MIEENLEARRRLTECYKNFMLWLLEYCMVKEVPVWKEIGFIIHIERTSAAIEENIELLEKDNEISKKSDFFNKRHFFNKAPSNDTFIRQFYP